MISIESSVWLTEIGDWNAAGMPAGISLSESPASPPNVAATPVHLIDPSGQYARGQVWIGTSLPRASFSSKVVVF